MQCIATTKVKIKNNFPQRALNLSAHTQASSLEWNTVESRVKSFFSCFFFLPVTKLHCGLNGWMRCREKGGYYMNSPVSCLPVQHIFPKQPFLCNRIHHPGMGFLINVLVLKSSIQFGNIRDKSNPLESVDYFANSRIWTKMQFSTQTESEPIT